MALTEKIIPINIEEEMKTAYIDYSMSVIVARALPDVRDGLKPVHRRVLFGMSELGVSSGRPYKKSARIVGEVLGKYHPHGDISVYDAMVRMAQEWSLRYPLIDGQGNFGSIDGDSAAAMRYTEVRLQKIAEEMLSDLDKDTVDFRLNFDDTLEEPTVLPSKTPNLLINGASGIAVGMATNMLPHNLTEVINGVLAYIGNNDITIEELMTHIKAPDFPTGGIIYGFEGVKEAFETGRGKIVVRAKTEIELGDNEHETIIVSEIPYQVNKSQMIIRTVDLINDKKIEGISNLRDESDRDGMRIVYELKRSAIAKVVLNQLFKHTQLQTSFGVNNIALSKGKPKMMHLKDLILHFVDHRHEVVVRRTKYELAEAEKRAHILEGLLIALDNLDAVIKLIRASKTVEEARDGLMKTFKLSEIQAKAILEMRLQKLTGLEREKIKDEYKELQKLIEYYNSVLGSEELRMEIISDELLEIKDKYGDERRTEIQMAAGEFRMEDIIADEEMVITISHLGYLKRTTLTEYRKQNRGGKGSLGGTTRDEDYIEHMFVASAHHYILFFTEKGKCYWLRVYEIPEGGKATKGRAVQNLLNISEEDKIKAFIKVKDLTDEEYLASHYVVFCTKKGIIKKTPLTNFSRPRQSGIIAITIRPGDNLRYANFTNGESEILIGVKSGKAIRFNESKVRAMGRSAAGVRGIKLADDKDEVIGMLCVTNPEATILVLSQKGVGKRSRMEDYRITNRGGKGVKTINISDKTGHLIAIRSVVNEDDILIINKSGLTIRMEVNKIKVQGRNTMGVRVIRLNPGDEIAALAKVENLNGGSEDDEDKGTSDNVEESQSTDTENKRDDETGDLFQESKAPSNNGKDKVEDKSAQKPDKTKPAKTKSEPPKAKKAAKPVKKTKPPKAAGKAKDKKPKAKGKDKGKGKGKKK